MGGKRDSLFGIDRCVLTLYAHQRKEERVSLTGQKSSSLSNRKRKHSRTKDSQLLLRSRPGLPGGDAAAAAAVDEVAAPSGDSADTAGPFGSGCLARPALALFPLPLQWLLEGPPFQPTSTRFREHSRSLLQSSSDAGYEGWGS